MKISVVIASYGELSWSELAHERALPSVQDQDCEVIIGHDENATITQIRNQLAQKATGDWLCFLDADDQLAVQFIPSMQRIGAAIRDEDMPQLLTPAIAYVHPSGKIQRPIFWPECNLETGNWLVIGTLVPKALFDQIGGFHHFPHGLEDWNLWARCVRTGAKIQKVKRAIYIAYRNRNSAHHVLLRDKKRYWKAYEAARLDAWE